MRILLSVIFALLFLPVPCTFAQTSLPAGPNGFTLNGEWDCKGQFINGKPHHSHYSVEPVLGGAWLQLSERDIDPPGYLSQYLIRFDPVQKLFIDEDLNNFGYARYASPGWQGPKLIFTSTEAHYAQPLPENRFVYTVTGPKSFDVSWESRRDKSSDFKSSDTIHCEQSAEAGSTANPLQVNLTARQKIDNVFSRTVAIHADGIDDAVRRVSGTAHYEVIDPSPNHIALKAEALYDGRPLQNGTAEYRDHLRTGCWQDQCRPVTDASGPFYNPLIWGDAPAALTPGMTWQVAIRQPWELGPAATETVTVISLDTANHEVTLKREGSGEGWYDSERKQVQVKKDGKDYTVDITPGISHWVGYTTFQHGVVRSDELLVDRDISLSAADFPRTEAKERQYILLNAAP
jgi:hypothetical protein